MNLRKQSSLWVFLCILLFLQPASAQFFKGQKPEPKKPPGSNFLDSQWWLGVMAGTNVSSAWPLERFSAYSPINGSPERLFKDYENFEQWGAVFGVEASYSYKRFSLVMQPNFRRYRFAHTHRFDWENSEGGEERLSLDYRQSYNLDYLDVPLLLRYEFLDGPWRPFIEAGAAYSFLLAANQSIVVEGVDEASGASGPFITNRYSESAYELFNRHNFVWGGGIGLSYIRGNVRLNLAFQYRQTFDLVNDPEMRFSDSRLVGIGDVPDDMMMRNITGTLSCLLPMRFLTSDFNSIKRQ